MAGIYGLSREAVRVKVKVSVQFVHYISFVEYNKRTAAAAATAAAIFRST